MAKRLPKLPRSIHSHLGPIPIVWVQDLKARDGDEALGLWCPEERCIKLRAGMDRKTEWATLRHEWIHATLWDAGVGLTSRQEERVCDAISTALVAEMLG